MESDSSSRYHAQASGDGDQSQESDSESGSEIQIAEQTEHVVEIVKQTEQVTEIVERHEQVHFSIGETFSTWQEFKDKLTNYEKDNFFNTCMRDSRLIGTDSAKRRTPLKKYNPGLIYYSVKVVCSFGGKHKSRGRDIRKTKTFKQDCPMYINLGVTQDSQKLMIRTMELSHNHILSEEVYLRMPHQRRLTDDVRKMAAAVLKMKGDKKLLRERLMEETGKVIYMKDIQNLSHKVRHGAGEPVFVTPKTEPRTDEEDEEVMEESQVADWLSTSRQTHDEDDQAVFAIKRQLAEEGDKEDKKKQREQHQRDKERREEFRRFMKGSRAVPNAQCTSRAARWTEEASEENPRLKVWTLSGKRRRRDDDSHDEDDEDDEETKREMSKLKLEHQRLQNYKAKLEILEMEMKLRVQHSSFTSELLFQSGSK